MNKLLFHIIWVLLLGTFGQSFGQTSSPLGRFEVDYIKGCAPLTVSITDLLGDPTAQYLYDADTCVVSSPKYDPAACPPTNTSTNLTYTYTLPGSYSLVQVISTGIRGDTIVIEVLPPQSPEFNVTLCNSFGVSVNITDNHYDQFTIDYGDGSPATSNRTHTYPPGTINYPISVSGYFNNGPINCGESTVTLMPVNNIPTANISQVSVVNTGLSDGVIDLEFTLNPNVEYILQEAVNGTAGFNDIGLLAGNSFILTGLNTVNNLYCYRIAALDNCSASRIYSDTICSTNINVSVQEGQNQINWSTIPIQFDRYELTKNGASLGPPITNSNTTVYPDLSIECNVVYCYQTTTVNSNGSRSISTEFCVTGINNLPPPTINTLTASVDGSGISLNWTPSGPFDFYQVFRSENNGSFEQIGSETDLPFIDPTLRPQLNTYCYYVIYENSCGRQSEPSVVACAIKLAGINVENKDFALNWTQYTGWQNGISDYELEILDETGALLEPPMSLGSNISSYRDPISRQLTYYRIVAISNDSIPLRSYSNLVEADIPLQIFAPNSFTPNNDGLNDTFSAKGLFIETYSMEIYSRWGELLFHTTDIEQGWNGVYRGSLIPEDTYAYKISATDQQGRSLAKNGTVHLLRKQE